MPIHRPRLATSALLGLSATLGIAVCAAAADTRVVLSGHDGSIDVDRTFVVTATSGDRIPGLVVLKAFDPARKTFVFTRYDGSSVDVAVTDLRSIAFRQDVRRSNQMAQTAIYRDVAIVRGEQRQVKVPAARLDVNETGLALVGVDAPADARDRWEARTLTYDRGTDTFVVDIERVTYVVTVRGGGGGSSGASGIRKGLP